MDRYTVVKCLAGAEVFDQRAGRPIDWQPNAHLAELLALALNRSEPPREPRFSEL